MRQVLINYAEKRSAQKRGGGAAVVTLHDDDATVGDSLDELLVLNRALEGLEQASPRAAQVVDCMFFAGLSIAETAEALECAPGTVRSLASQGVAALRVRLDTDEHDEEGAIT